MTLTISNEIPENIRRGLLAKAEGKNWEECAEIAKISNAENERAAMRFPEGHLIFFLRLHMREETDTHAYRSHHDTDLDVFIVLPPGLI